MRADLLRLPLRDAVHAAHINDGIKCFRWMQRQTGRHRVDERSF